MQSVLPKRTLRLRYLSLHRGLSELLYRHDPVGLAALGAPKDEYESEASTIIPKLKGATGPDDVCRIVHQEFLHWFEDEQTAGPESEYNAIACKMLGKIHQALACGTIGSMSEIAWLRQLWLAPDVIGVASIEITHWEAGIVQFHFPILPRQGEVVTR